MSPESERDLVDRLRRGDRDAFDRVYELYRARLFGFLARMTKRQDLAEETWLRVARCAANLRDDTRLGPWLFTVARNLFLSVQRRHLLHLDRVSELARLAIADELVASPFEHVAAGEAERDLERALAALPTHHREVILLVAVIGLSPAEAAAVCELEPATFRKRLSRARARLAEALERDRAVAPRLAKEGVR
jgi:RNA polymerase sigma-70 factor (ECF subfamily)